MDDISAKKRILSVGGSHLTMNLRMGHKKYGILIPKTTDGRVLFVLPWLD
jgi:glycerol-3-phosphate dehydrogenase